MINNKKFTSKDICAVIVSYNPELLLIENLKSLLPQIDSCVVVDNGSTKTDVVKKVKEQFKIRVVELSVNKGIAYALNRGVEYCKAKGYALVLTMDQDTILDQNAVDEMLKIINKSKASSVGINWDGKAGKDKYVDYLITSGNLVYLDAVLAVGGYDEKLFIDSVDFDISLRWRNCGYILIKAAKATAVHNLGERQGSTDYITHSKERYYYIYRNHFYLIRKHWHHHKLFCLKKHIVLIIDIFRILFFDKEKAKLKMLHKGYTDSKLFM